MPTPMERLIDAAMVCTHCGAKGMTCDCWKPKQPQPDPRVREVIDSYARDVAGEVLAHIDTMYPALWQGVPKTARTSVRHCIVTRVQRVLQELLLP